MAQQPLNGATEGSTTKTIEETDGCQQTSDSTPTLQLRLEQPRDDRRVVFHDGVIDNEHMNRMKSKCCCIYRKPLAFGESSSEDDDECEHCFGHPEKRKKKKKPADTEPSTSNQAQGELDQTPATAASVAEELPPPGPAFEKTVTPSL
ncbi:hypothetical protein KR222_010644 [Zaprionus bogoriensis]|nr:hypothetical protein KR222_010644 [Zaprionus bogoriensis]